MEGFTPPAPRSSTVSKHVQDRSLKGNHTSFHSENYQIFKWFIHSSKTKIYTCKVSVTEHKHVIMNPFSVQVNAKTIPEYPEISTLRAEIDSPALLIATFVWWGVWQFADRNIYTRNAMGFIVAAHLSPHQTHLDYNHHLQTIPVAHTNFTHSSTLIWRCFCLLVPFSPQRFNSIAITDMAFYSEKDCICIYSLS